MPVTVITRNYRGRTISVNVLLDEGFEFEGEVYRSPIRRSVLGIRAVVLFLLPISRKFSYSPFGLRRSVKYEEVY
ncbi:MAG: DUF2924 domain-containing protein [Candidatus Eisenbacteria bacterium]|uniref:DUF2924 domain-containing protein n=1 Tax=Eiseniibacteriota bacterium TaxID=2212470 RepID=A0A948RXI2_UNCEI|nr:DUF2924 domain-containing protein [Candidatus Eisenbacteria bacterium]MBU1950703.1 DUF2924 domain-containing protein [Candidatus Eisenbacteria bacterium]MBU2690882.1 DUF2924 domain-containing protein [Candidatus Eisenbacteria bacterium]